MRDPDDVIEEAEREREAIREHYLPAVEWFLDTPGLERREEVVEDLAAGLELEEQVARAVVSHLVSDDMDPVQQVTKPSEGRFVGVISYAEHGWFYTFDRYDDVEGRQTRAVCARCVREAESEAAVSHYTRSATDYDHDAATAALGLHHRVDHEDASVGTAVRDLLGVAPGALAESDSEGLTVDRAVASIEERGSLSRVGNRVRSAIPDLDVDPGATLVSGTTMGGNQAWHAGNVSGGSNVTVGTTSISLSQGSGSGLNADQVDGREASSFRAIQQNTAGNPRVAVYKSVKTTFTAGDPTGKTRSPTIPVSGGPVFLAFKTPTSVDFRGFSANGSSLGGITYGRLVTGVTVDTFTFNFKLTTNNGYTRTATGVLRVGEYATTV